MTRAAAARTSVLILGSADGASLGSHSECPDAECSCRENGREFQPIRFRRIGKSFLRRVVSAHKSLHGTLFVGLDALPQHPADALADGLIGAEIVVLPEPIERSPIVFDRRDFRAADVAQIIAPVAFAFLFQLAVGKVRHACAPDRSAVIWKQRVRSRHNGDVPREPLRDRVLNKPAADLQTSLPLPSLVRESGRLSFIMRRPSAKLIGFSGRFTLMVFLMTAGPSCAHS